MRKPPLRDQGDSAIARRPVLWLSLVLSLVAWMAPLAWGADDAISRETLQRLEGVRVRVEDFTPGVTSEGRTRDQVQTAVEERLRQAGIPILTERERATLPGNPYLAITVKTQQTTGGLSGLSVYAIAVAFKQNAVLVRDSDLRAIGAATWSVGASGSVDRDHLQQLWDAVDTQIDTFIQAYLSVNPKRSVNPEQSGPMEPSQPARIPGPGSPIHQTQARLAEQGFDPGPRDGQMGPKTQAALRQFQRAHGLPLTGKLDEATRAALGID
jgi:hypothetical protein